jgi:serine/threonine protein kinase
LLDSNNSVKLADFGWSNFFNGDRRRLTYCGTPEYLAPEMIKQSGHDKSLDIWNIGVLLFELLTGTPPFEGANQNELFDNILNFRIKWPKGFSGVAKDLVSKLLKTTPSERLSLEEVTNHPWFKANPPLKPVITENANPAPVSLKFEIDGDIKKENY